MRSCASPSAGRIPAWTKPRCCSTVRCMRRWWHRARPTSRPVWPGATKSSGTWAAWAQILPTNRARAAERRKYKEDESTHKTLDAVEQMGHVEIQEEPDADTTQLQIREHLR